MSPKLLYGHELCFMSWESQGLQIRVAPQVFFWLCSRTGLTLLIKPSSSVWPQFVSSCSWRCRCLSHLRRVAAGVGQYCRPQVKSLPEPQSEEQFCRMSLPHGAWSDGNGVIMPEICWRSLLGCIQPRDGFECCAQHKLWVRSCSATAEQSPRGGCAGVAALVYSDICPLWCSKRVLAQWRRQQEQKEWR